MKRLLIVFGTRPEAIKMAPLVMELKKHSEFNVKVCVTAQHREMLDSVLDLFEIKPEYDLDLMKKGQDLYDVTSRVLLGMRDVLRTSNPDFVLVHGDTTTSMAASLASFYEKIPVAHVEAGLRTKNIYSPWPEEINRQMTGRIASIHFAPTEGAKKNLIDEGVSAEKIVITGNTVIDALHIMKKRIEEDENFKKAIISELSDEIPEELLDRKMVLVTGHRRENFGSGFRNICSALRKAADEHPEIQIVYPVHLNPNVRKPVNELLSDVENISLIPPLDYHQFIYMMYRSHIVLTDSGGIQEEAPGLGKPVLVMRDTTERPEAVEAGTVKLVGTDENTILSNLSELIKDENSYRKMSKAVNPYGDGKACGRIAEFFKKN